MTQEEALAVMRSGANVFLTGNAGTGKTYTLQLFIDELRLKDKNVVVTAPTGIAAINAGGATIHSTFKMFGYYPEPRYPNRQRVDWEKTDLLVVDEISMVGPDYLDQIDFTLKHHCRNTKPFGGIQVVLVGDAKQLPPVYSEFTEADQEAVSKLKSKYGNLTFSSAESYSGFSECHLDEVKRTNNPTLIALLNEIREGKISAVHRFNQGTGDAQAIHLYPFNNMVDAHNSKELSKIQSPKKEYTARWGGKFDVKNAITPVNLELKVGARVMVTKNMDNGLVNGDMGVVKKLGDESVTIFSDRFDMEFELFSTEWKMVEYDGVEEVTVGWFRQIPLKLGFALTVHKSQGLTLDDVCVHYVKGISQELLYVGLSRATTFEKLFVKIHG